MLLNGLIQLSEHVLWNIKFILIKGNLYKSWRKQHTNGENCTGLFHVLI